MSLTTLGLLGVTGTMLSLLFMPLAIKLAGRMRAIDEPESRRVHDTPIPRMGGLAITLAFIITSTFFVPLDSSIIALLLGLCIALATGVADDIWQIHPLVKMAGQVAAASIFVLVSGVSIDSFGNLFGFGVIGTGRFAVPVTIFAIVAVMNALNLSDGLDGLAGGLSIIACVFIMFFAVLADHWSAVALMMALMGSILAFLYFNMHPAKIFMGDSGALSLGYLLSAVCILLVYDGRAEVGTLQPVSFALILALPILDTLWVMLRRLAVRQSPSVADNRHLHHAILSMNLSSSATVSVLYISMFAFCVLAVIMRSVVEWIQFYLAIVLATLVLGGVAVLQHRNFVVRFDWLQHETDLKDLAFFQAMSKLMVKSITGMIWLVPIAFIIPIIAFPHIQSSASLISFLIGGLILLMFPWRAAGERDGWLHGLIYITTVMLLIHLNVNGPVWAPQYLQFVTLLISIWVGLKLAFRNHGRIFFTSSFEVLMIMVVWLLPLMTGALDFTPETQRLLLHSCIESIPFLLAMKIMIRDQPNKSKYLVAGLAFAFMLIGVRQFIAPWPDIGLL